MLLALGVRQAFWKQKDKMQRQSPATHHVECWDVGGCRKTDYEENSCGARDVRIKLY